VSIVARICSSSVPVMGVAVVVVVDDGADVRGGADEPDVVGDVDEGEVVEVGGVAVLSHAAAPMSRAAARTMARRVEGMTGRAPLGPEGRNDGPRVR
jgi:hypothetical protein